MTDIQNQFQQSKRDKQLGALLDHCLSIPDAKEVFGLLDLLRDMGALTTEECAMLIHLYWEGEA